MLFQALVPIMGSYRQGSVVQVYTGYFWFCVMYFFLAIIVTQVMMMYPPLGQPKSNWKAWAKVTSGSLCFVLHVGIARMAPDACTIEGAAMLEAQEVSVRQSRRLLGEALLARLIFPGMVQAILMWL